jgi:stage II sporulation protein D
MSTAALPIRYSVKPGDSLWTISQKYNTTPEELIQLNGLTRNNINEGQVLIIPTHPADPAALVYLVQRGDSLWTIAQRFGTTVEALKRINSLHTDEVEVDQMLMIRDTKEPLQTTYTAQAGDSLWSIANQYNTTVDELMRVNNLSNNQIEVGQRIIVQTPPPESLYTVKPGDSLWTIALQFNTTVENLRSMNDLHDDQIFVGQILKTKKDTLQRHTVKSGESLWTIANYYGMTVDNLRQINGLTSNELAIGQILLVEAKSTPPVTTTVTHTVKAGESLYSIANQYGMTVEQVRELNNLTSTNLSIGQRLVVYYSVKSTDANIVVTVRRLNGNLQWIPLEDYVLGVVAAELADGFNQEAYRVQAVAARTYALKRVKEGKTISDTDGHQVFQDLAQLRKRFGDRYSEIMNPIKRAVEETRGEVIYYQNELIDALFFSTSNGKTEDPRNVWGGSLPYIRVVNSQWDTRSPYYYNIKNIPLSQFRSRLGLSSGASLYTNVLSRTDGDSVDRINIAGKTFTGEAVRRALSLRSTDFDISFTATNAVVRQRGWGHQVGLSQYGSHFMGEEGWNYQDIIRHYYAGVEIRSIF